MGKPNGPAAIFALSLRRSVDSYERRTGDGAMSLRRLGKITDPADPERGRRRAQRHLSGRIAPSPASQRVYAEALRESELLPDDADEEAALDQALLRDVRARVAANPRAAVDTLRFVLDEVTA